MRYIKKNHEHQWVKNGKKDGKQRMRCKICGKTCGIADIDLTEKLYNLNLQLIHSYPYKEKFVWEEVVELDENNEEIEIPEQSYKYKVNKIKKSLPQFISMLKTKNRLYKPMIVYMCEADIDSPDWRNNQLLVYEVF